MKPNLRCPVKALSELAERYSYGRDDGELVGFQDGIQDRGYMHLNELLTLARWKAPRSAGRVKENSAEYVEEITQVAFSTKTERARIELLTLLSGVGWPTASVILHFYHPEPYPIIDFRALWTLNMSVPHAYDYLTWKTYVDMCRELSKESGLSMRTLDRALWQYSKENQKREG